VIDLHMHTTASDGTCTPADLLEHVRRACIDTFAVADHDTVGAVEECVALAERAGLRCIPAVEITAVHEGKDVHMLGYFVDVQSPSLRTFLEEGRTDRLRRARAMSERLAELGVPIDMDRLLEDAGGPNSGKAIARPVVARALVAAGHVSSVQEAFDRFLAEGRPAYCARIGASPAEVVRIIGNAGGVASLAHPGPLKKDSLLEALASQGLTAVECFHSEHDEETTQKYLDLARRLDLAVTGGSDFHGPGTRRAEHFGTVNLPQQYFDEFVARARATAAAAR
jgi:predicted metal-dependent phosphoesterase TrpH